MPRKHWDGTIIPPLDPAPPVRDVLGRDLAVGDFITYGTLLGRSAGLKIGRIHKIEVYKRERYEGFDYAIGVEGVTYDWWSGPGHKPAKGKKGTLMFPDRCCRVSSADIPVEILKLYDQA